ncbi:MAG: chromosomal replication initiator protein DnaA [Chloroflexi bacterium]|nr:chromosomal replication initiator protein DnaA [Chloroflexota bacterium]
MSSRAQQPSQIWDAALGELQLQVDRTAFETWFKKTDGVALNDGEFVVGTETAFISEMLTKRMSQIVERAVGHVLGEPTSVRFQVLTHADNPANGQSANDNDTGADCDRDDSQAASIANAASSHPAPAAFAPAPSLNARYTFDRFVVGKSNELAHAAARAVADNPGNVYNPLVLYSDVGLGKTHLMHAIGHQAVESGMQPVYLTTEEFTNEFIAAIKEGTTEGFRARYRGADMLLLDDIQFLIGKEQMQEGFFHTFNALHMSNRQIVITCDRPVSALRTLEERITSRLEWGLVVDINPPDLETRIAILHAKAEQMGLNIDASVLGLLAERISRNIRELEGILNRAVAYAQFTKRILDAELARHVIEGTLADSARHQPTEQETLDAVAAHFGVDLETLRGRKRDKKTALARQVAMYILREDVQMNASAIARTLGRKDHTTVLYGCKTIENQQNADAKLRRDILQIRQSMS